MSSGPRNRDVTFVLGVRNRGGLRLANALRSIRMQQYTLGRVSALVVDYGSSPEQLMEITKICSSQQATLLAVPVKGQWNRSHCLNIGIRAAATPYVFLGDVDVIYPLDFVEVAMEAIGKSRLLRVHSALWDLPEEARDVCLSDEPDTYRKQFADLLDKADSRKVQMQVSMLLVEREVLRKIGGLDEQYAGWGFEDLDLHARLWAYGLERANIADRAVMLHQWHERYEGVKDKDFEQRVEKNRAYFQRARQIKRNNGRWGQTVTKQRDGNDRT
ncbi:MAG: glycosyltransferase family 2 protein [Phycisphaerae bacterium]